MTAETRCEFCGRRGHWLSGCDLAGAKQYQREKIRAVFSAGPNEMFAPGRPAPAEQEDEATPMRDSAPVSAEPRDAMSEPPALPSLGGSAPTHEPQIGAALTLIEEAMDFFCDQPVVADRMGLTRVWRDILENLVGNVRATLPSEGARPAQRDRTSVPEGSTPYRWNEDDSVWEFYTESWGGWCILRSEPGETSPPMSHVEGSEWIGSRPWLNAVAVSYPATKHEPRRAPSEARP